MNQISLEKMNHLKPNGGLGLIPVDSMLIALYGKTLGEKSGENNIILHLKKHIPKLKVANWNNFELLKIKYRNKAWPDSINDIITAWCKLKFKIYDSNNIISIKSDFLNITLPYSVKSIREKLFIKKNIPNIQLLSPKITSNIFKSIFKYTQPKISIITWRVITENTITGKRVKLWADEKCINCTHYENTVHRYFTCHLAKFTWKLIFSTMNHNIIEVNNWEDYIFYKYTDFINVNILIPQITLWVIHKIFFIQFFEKRSMSDSEKGKFLLFILEENFNSILRLKNLNIIKKDLLNVINSNPNKFKLVDNRVNIL